MNRDKEFAESMQVLESWGEPTGKLRQRYAAMKDRRAEVDGLQRAAREEIAKMEAEQLARMMGRPYS
ncbi:hypothetical protein ACOANS_29375 [Pseudomonas aeruginosa]